jgi:hypothetical protein
MRQAGIKPSSAYVVTPKGLIKKIAYAQNIGSVIKQNELRGADGRSQFGKPFIVHHMSAAGWVLLEDLYKNDPDPEVAAEGFDHYVRHARMLETRAHGAYKMKERSSGKTERLFPAKFPDEWLPAEVLSRREGKSDVNGPSFQAPPSRKKKAAKSGKPQHKASSQA